MVVGCLQYGEMISRGRAFATKGKEIISPCSYCLDEFQKKSRVAEYDLNQAKEDLEVALEAAKDIEKTIAETSHRETQS